MVQKRGTKAVNKLCVREILSLSFVCGAYFFEFRGRNLVCFVIVCNFNGKYAPEAGKTRMRTAFFTRARKNRMSSWGELAMGRNRYKPVSLWTMTSHQISIGDFLQDSSSYQYKVHASTDGFISPFS